MAGTLLVVGSGIAAVAQITTETLEAVRQAEIVFYGVADPVTHSWIVSQNANCHDLSVEYRLDRTLAQTYSAMVGRIVAAVEQGQRVCAIFYGHPGVFVHAGHQAVRAARASGCVASMLPGVSAMDCLFSDLLFDPSAGVQIYEATDFLVYAKTPDRTCGLILWQAAHLGELSPADAGIGSKNLAVLRDYLQRFYPPDHGVTIYEASALPTAACRTEIVSIADLGEAEVSRTTTLFVPPSHAAVLDSVMVKRLGLTVHVEEGP